MMHPSAPTLEAELRSSWRSGPHEGAFCATFGEAVQLECPAVAGPCERLIDLVPFGVASAQGEAGSRQVLDDELGGLGQRESCAEPNDQDVALAPVVGHS